MRIGDTVNVKDLVGNTYWKGKVTEIHNSREITIQGKGIDFAIIDIDDLVLDNNEYWEK